MGNTRNTGFLQNAVKVANNGDISLMHGNTMLMQISASGAITTTGVISGSNALSASFASTASFVNLAQTASFVANAQSASNAVVAQTASYANALTVAGTLTAQTLVVQTITSSVDFVTGSTRFGSISGNTHVFTGSVFITGSIGIGINNPTFPLTRNGMTLRASGTDGVEFVMLSSTDTGFTGGALVRSNADFGFVNRTSGSLIFATNAVERMWVSSSGNVGIGTSSPSTLLDLRLATTDGVTGSVSSSYAVASFVVNASGGGQRGLQVGGPTGNISSPVFLKVFGTGNRFAVLNESNVENLTVTSGGNVGISTISPSDKLHISASDTSGILITGGTNGRKVALHGSSINFYTTTAPAGYAMGHYILKGSDSSVLAAISGVYGSQDTADYTFYGGLAYNDAAMYIAGKNVGIGTSTPNNLLSVRGNLDLGTTGFAFAGPSQYGGLMFPRGQILYSNTNTQNQFYLSSNAYTNNNGVFAYRNSGQPALALGLDNGGMSFLTAGNGTANAVISWTTAIGISNNGTVTRPNQPAFLAFNSTGFTVTANGWYNISNAITSEAYDIGSNYGTSTAGRFIAPVAGRYFFYAGGWSNIASNGERYAFCARVNDGPLFYIGGGNYCIGDTPLSGYSIVHNLAAGDFVDLWVFSAVGGNWGGSSHGVWWGGYLL